jgi:NitT/TauT family transport system permease protein
MDLVTLVEGDIHLTEVGNKFIDSSIDERKQIFWKTLILPGIFPDLITGIITAVGGVWNACIVSEYVQFQGKTLTTPGLGETISIATETGNFSLLLAATAVMSSLVVITNRLVWRPLYQLAQNKYQLL